MVPLYQEKAAELAEQAKINGCRAAGKVSSLFPDPSRRVQLQHTDTITGPVRLGSELERLCSDHTDS